MDTRIIAIRHGQTHWNAEGRIQGHLNSNLNEEGRVQARAVAARLSSDDAIAAIYCSDLGRTLETAQPTSEGTGLPIMPDARLRERNLGVFEGLTFRDAEMQFPDYFIRFRARDPELDLATGESLIAFRDRVAAAVADIGHRHESATVLVVTHGGVLDLLYRLATGMSLEQARTFDVENASLNFLRWDGLRLHIERWGDISHHETHRARDEF